MHEAKKGPTRGTKWVDYAAQFDTKRLHTATCALRERHNMEVALYGVLPYDHVLQLRQCGSRPAKTLTLRKQHVYVFFSFFASGFKPSAVTHNVIAEDITNFMKRGRSVAHSCTARASSAACACQVGGAMMHHCLMALWKAHQSQSCPTSISR